MFNTRGGGICKILYKFAPQNSKFKTHTITMLERLCVALHFIRHVVRL